MVGFLKCVASSVKCLQVFAVCGVAFLACAGCQSQGCGEKEAWDLRGKRIDEDLGIWASRSDEYEYFFFDDNTCVLAVINEDSLFFGEWENVSSNLYNVAIQWPSGKTVEPALINNDEATLYSYDASEVFKRILYVDEDLGLSPAELKLFEGDSSMK